MADASHGTNMTEDDDQDEKTNSSLACLMLEIATIISVATIDPIHFGHFLGLSESKIAEIDTGLEDPKSKIIHILERFRDRHGDNWKAELQEIVRTKVENPVVVQKLHEVTSTQSITNSGYPDVNKGSIIQESLQANPNQRQDVKSRQSSTSGWDMGSGGHGRHSNEGDTSSESFERLSDEAVFQSRDGEHSNEENTHQSLDHPEMSLQITRVGEALRVVSDLLGNVDGISELPHVIPEILRLVRQMKSQKMLRHVFEEENSNLKQDLQRANEIIRDLRVTLEKLEMEIQDLKKTAEDKSLKDFDYVTRKEAADMREEEKKLEQKVTTPTPTSSSEGVSIEAYEALQKKIISLKQKLAQVVKLNHSWDEQYHRMELALKHELEKTNVIVAEKNQEMERREKEKDEILNAAKHRIEELEAEKADQQKNADQNKEQLGKLNRYAVSLKQHKEELETEIKRLNGALEQKVKEKKPVAVAAPPSKPKKPIETRKGKEALLLSHEERSFLASLSQDELIDELGLLKQQVDIYKSDFYKEQRDRQRAMGEVEEVKTELIRTKKKMEKQKQELQILKDQALAFQFHADERKHVTAATRQRKPPQKTQTLPQDKVFELLGGDAYPQRYTKTNKPKELVPHGGVNYALNDEYVDAQEEFQICYPPDDSENEKSDPFYFALK